jgi:hypothetical protein
MSWTDSMPKLTRALEIPTTSCYSHPTSAACLSLIHPRARGSLLVPSTGPTCRGDIVCVPAPLPVLPLAPLGLSPIGKGGSSVPPTSG